MPVSARVRRGARPALSAAALAAALAFVPSPRASATLELDLAQRGDSLKRIIDFFELNNGDFGADLKPVQARYNVKFGGLGTPSLTQSNGMVQVANLMNLSGRDAAKTFVAGALKQGVHIYEIWSEPNRTWGPQINGQDNWLKTAKWTDFLDRTGQIYLGAKDADPDCILTGPDVTSDVQHDPDWFDHLRTFLDYWKDHGYKLDYVNFNPPYEPDDVTRVSQLAQAYAGVYPQLGIKGIASGEYPFYLDTPARHVRFFIAYEEAFNTLFAAKSYFRAGCCNSGLIDKNNQKLPVYYTYVAYANMRGARLPSAKGGPSKMVQALSAYDAANKRLHILVANDQAGPDTVTLRVKGAAGEGTAAVSGFSGSGIQAVKTLPVSAKDGVVEIPLDTVPALGAYAVTVDFKDAQPTALRRAPEVTPALPGPALWAAGPGPAWPAGATAAAVYGLDGAKLWGTGRGADARLAWPAGQRRPGLAVVRFSR